MGFLNSIYEWCEGKSPWARLPLVLWCWYALFNVWEKNQIWWNPFQYLDLGIHELGHWTTIGLGQTFSIAAGTLFQWALPCVVMGAFWKQRDLFAIAFTFSWLGLSVLHTSEYASTASENQLVIGHIGETEMYHDWHYLLSHWGILHRDIYVAHYLWTLSVFFSAIAVIATTGLVATMILRKAQ